MGAGKRELPFVSEQAWKGTERCPDVLEGRGRWLALAGGSPSPGKGGRHIPADAAEAALGGLILQVGPGAGGPSPLPFFHRYFPKAWPVSGAVLGVHRVGNETGRYLTPWESAVLGVCGGGAGRQTTNTSIVHLPSVANAVKI